MNSRRPLYFWLIAVWVIAFVVALTLDRHVAQWVHDAQPVNKDAPMIHRVLAILKLPGNFIFTLCVAAIVAFTYPRRMRGAIALIVSGVAVGLAYSVIKWIAGRHRPFKGIGTNADPFGFHPFPRGFRGLFDPENALCFPSGHASLSFATAMCLGMLMPRARWIFFAIALMTTAERVIENAHYLSDAVAGIGLGVTLGWLVTRAVLNFDASTAPDARPVD